MSSNAKRSPRVEDKSQIRNSTGRMNENQMVSPRQNHQVKIGSNNHT